jgi:hypothetical protein
MFDITDKAIDPDECWQDRLVLTACSRMPADADHIDAI